ncbi:MAG: hypothetical protein WCB55_07580, partial [Pseudolabrys sp.]
IFSPAWCSVQLITPTCVACRWLVLGTSMESILLCEDLLRGGIRPLPTKGANVEPHVFHQITAKSNKSN